MGVHFIGSHTKLAAVPAPTSEGASIHFDNITNYLFIATADKMFVLNPNERSPAIAEVLSIEAVGLPSRTKWSGSILVWYTMKEVHIYRLDIQTFALSRTVRFAKLHSLDKFNDKPLNCADVDIAAEEVWVLDR